MDLISMWTEGKPKIGVRNINIMLEDINKMCQKCISDKIILKLEDTDKLVKLLSNKHIKQLRIYIDIIDMVIDICGLTHNHIDIIIQVIVQLYGCSYGKFNINKFITYCVKQKYIFSDDNILILSSKDYPVTKFIDIKNISESLFNKLSDSYKINNELMIKILKINKYTISLETARNYLLSSNKPVASYKELIDCGFDKKINIYTIILPHNLDDIKEFNKMGFKFDDDVFIRYMGLSQLPYNFDSIINYYVDNGGTITEDHLLQALNHFPIYNNEIYMLLLLELGNITAKVCEIVCNATTKSTKWMLSYLITSNKFIDTPNMLKNCLIADNYSDDEYVINELKNRKHIVGIDVFREIVQTYKKLSPFQSKHMFDTIQFDYECLEICVIHSVNLIPLPIYIPDKLITSNMAKFLVHKYQICAYSSTTNTYASDFYIKYFPKYYDELLSYIRQKEKYKSVTSVTNPTQYHHDVCCIYNKNMAGYLEKNYNFKPTIITLRHMNIADYYRYFESNKFHPSSTDLAKLYL